MSESIYERIHRMLSWKRIVGFNVVLFLVLVIPLSVRLAQVSTENRSSAATETPAPVVTPPPDYPEESPRIDRVALFYGKPGDTVAILGSHFGAYQWDSKVYVGNVEALPDFIVKWSDSVIEVKIPESARSGNVWVSVNGQRATWDGTLLLYTNSGSAAEIGLRPESTTEAVVFVKGGSGATRGMVQIAYVSEPVTFSPAENAKLTSQSSSSDPLGKKLTLIFSFDSPLTSSETNIGTVRYPGIGSLEIIRAELYNNDTLIPEYANPLTLKFN